MAEFHNIAAITVLKANTRKKILFLINDGMRQKTDGNPLLAGIYVDDTEMHGLAEELSAIYRQFKAKPQTVTKSQVNTCKIKFANAYNRNQGFLQWKARDVAKAEGDVNAGVKLVEEAGYYIKNPKSATVNKFEARRDGAGAILIKTKAVAHHTTYIRQYGITTEDGVPPLPEALRELLIGPETEIRVRGLKSATIYAFREAYILPISRKANNSAPETKIEKTATPNVTGKAHKRTFYDTDATHYNWGPWIYVSIG